MTCAGRSGSVCVWILVACTGELSEVIFHFCVCIKYIIIHPTSTLFVFCQTNSKDILKKIQILRKAEKSKGFEFKKIAPKTSFLDANN